MTSINIYWYLLPLVLVVSLVWSATRHESWRRIWVQTARLCLKILVIVAITMAVLLLINSQIL